MYRLPVSYYLRTGCGEAVFSPSLIWLVSQVAGDGGLQYIIIDSQLL